MTTSIAWLVFALAIMLVSSLVGLHLGRFREAYTEMTGMMAGMTMGMLNGFLLGFAATAATGHKMFWGNLFGILLGLLLGVYFGRAGGLMGIMDGGMGGVMGGSMGAMLDVMLQFPPEGVYWTALLLTALYLAGTVSLVVLIERSAPGHAALHRLAPYFTRAMALEADETAAGHTQAQSRSQARPKRLVDYYAFLGVSRDATEDEIGEAYQAKVHATGDDGTEAERARRALSVLTDPARREAYDARLQAGRSAPNTPPAQGAQDSRNGRAQKRGHSPTPARGSRSAAGNRQPARSRGGGAGPLVVAGLGLLLVLGSLVWWTANLSAAQANGSRPAGFTDSGNPLPAEFESKLQSQAVAAPLAPDGRQTLDLAVNGDTHSYKPYAIKVKRGVPVHFNLSVEGSDPG